MQCKAADVYPSPFKEKKYQVYRIQVASHASCEIPIDETETIVVQSQEGQNVYLSQKNRKSHSLIFQQAPRPKMPKIRASVVSSRDVENVCGLKFVVCLSSSSSYVPIYPVLCIFRM